MNTPLEITRSLRVALVDVRPITRRGFDLFMRDVGQHHMVLSAGMDSELLSALRGGLELDVAFISLHASGFGPSKVVLKRLQQFHPNVRTVALLDRPDATLADYAHEAGAHTILPIEELTLVRFRELMEELGRQ